MGNTCSSASSRNLEQNTGEVTVRRYSTLGGRRPLETLNQAESCEKCRNDRTAAIRDHPVAVASGSLRRLPEYKTNGGLVTFQLKFTDLLMVYESNITYFATCEWSAQ